MEGCARRKRAKLAMSLYGSRCDVQSRQFTNSGSKHRAAKSRSSVAVQNGPVLSELIRSGWVGRSQSDAWRGQSGFFLALLPAATSTLDLRRFPPPLTPSSTQSIADHVGQIQPALRAHCRRCSPDRNPPVHGTLFVHTHVRTYIYIYIRPRPPNRPLNHAQLTSLSPSALLLPRPVPSHPSGQPPPLPLLPPSSPPAPPHGTTTSSVVRHTP
jgi:hypothetical protein